MPISSFNQSRKCLLNCIVIIFFRSSAQAFTVPSSLQIIHPRCSSSHTNTGDAVPASISSASSRRRSVSTILSFSSAPPQSTTPNSAALHELSPLEDWCANQVEAWYLKATSVKCPFFKRRFVDVLDAVDLVLSFVVVRHKSLPIFGPPPGHRSKLQGRGASTKAQYLSLQELEDAIRRDWKPATFKGYYITGQLNQTIFRDDCLFDGPDPDMPVRGLRKYVNAASQLFDRATSQAELLSLETRPLDPDTIRKSPEVLTLTQEHVIVARWKMQGVLRLPWKPTLPEWTGTTTYHLDDCGLVYWHEEEWDMSVAQAFLKTFVPKVAERLWPAGSSSLED